MITYNLENDRFLVSLTVLSILASHPQLIIVTGATDSRPPELDFPPTGAVSPESHTANPYSNSGAAPAGQEASDSPEVSQAREHTRRLLRNRWLRGHLPWSTHRSSESSPNRARRAIRRVERLFGRTGNTNPLSAEQLELPTLPPQLR